MKYSVSEFAEIIRTKHPRKYKGLTDSKTVELWLEKNPKDADLIKSEIIKNESWGCGSYLFLLLFIWFGLTVYNVKIDKINFINNINKDVFGNNPKFVNNDLFETDDTNSNVIITDSNNDSNENVSDSLDSEYSEDLGYYETPTTSYDNSNSSNSQNSQPENCYKCRGTGVCPQCSKTFSMQYYKGNGSYENRNETRPGLLMCNDCRGRGHKQSKRIEGGWEPGEDCYVSRCENGWVFCNECNSYGNGKLLGQCKECKGTGLRN